MREFKFRTWDNGQMHEASFNNLSCNYHHPNGKLIIREGGFPRSKSYITELMQYTGLKDCEGNEIYEGDVVEKAYINPMVGTEVKDRYIIAYENGCFKAQHCSKHPQRSTFLYFLTGNEIKSKVVGNIHENPELVGGEKIDK